MVGLSTVMLVTVFVGLGVWTARWIAKAEARGARADAAAAAAAGEVDN